ncbi:PucR family transcriptional regulator [Caniella muris]|uniref:PucR family transcriptional regulator n=1 Tax=Caniella muris TaxID=2941502 RepID=UPI00203F91C8|nr:PucR family transcriptional regulator [Caniella muris]
MRYTVSDFLASHAHQVRLVAGSGGLARPVADVGILDYEFMAGLKDRYQRDNFHENQLVLSTFLYAKDDPYLIVEAVRRLVAKGSSGLVIKNVLHLPIPEQAVRYANARDFPLFLTTSDDAFFDHIVYDVAAAAAAMAEAGFSQRTVDDLRRTTDSAKRRELALQLCPSFEEGCVAAWVQPDEPAGVPQVDALQRAWDAAGAASPACTVAPYDGGALVVVTSDDRVPDAPTVAARLAERVLPEAAGWEDAVLGLSEGHDRLEGLGCAVDEAVDAALVARARGGRRACHGDLGLLRAVLPLAGQPSMARFSAGVIGPLRDLDDEHGSSLETTLMAWWEAGQSVAETAAALDQHPNTVRYRLDRVRSATGLDWRSAADCQQLSLACAAAFCRGLKA